LEIRTDHQALRPHLDALAHGATWLAVAAERAVSRELGGSCSMPLAAHARWTDADTLTLDAALGHPADPARPLLRVRQIRVAADLAAAESLGRETAHALQALGAADYLHTP
jgi:hydroxymethylbilane synthase